MSATYFASFDQARELSPASYWYVALFSQHAIGDHSSLVARFLVMYKTYEGVAYVVIWY